MGYSGSYDLWQYSTTGQVAGVEGNVDLDYSYKNFLPLLQETGLNGYGTGRPAMQALSGKALQVTSARCEYFYSPNVDDVAGYLPLGTYPALELSEGGWRGYVWVTFRYEEQVFWAVLLEDRSRLIDAPQADCAACEEALEQLELIPFRRAIEAAPPGGDCAGADGTGAGCPGRSLKQRWRQGGAGYGAAQVRARAV